MDPSQINLTPAELKAVQEHRQRLCQQRGTEVSIEEAIRDFLQRFAEDWRREKMRLDNEEQRKEIERYKWLRSEKEGHDIGRAVAAREWCEKFAHIWRAERESLERNGFQRLSIVVKTEHGLHMRPNSAVAQLAGRFNCELYVHKDGMPYWAFLLEGRPFVNVKSILTLLTMGIKKGDTLEFIASGPQANEALIALAQLLTVPDPQPIEHLVPTEAAASQQCPG
ncbi:MAG: HPr family phosphocarrier protein [Verrucomicrobiae bacterium]|nr:HPr family phosphocarrier protein [Verrucomicrobiae bacterium]